LAKSNDFVFGTLSTEELRHQRALALREGVVHNHQRLPRDPLPGQDISIVITAGPANQGEIAWLYWTTDGSDPGGQFGKVNNGYVVPMQPGETKWDIELWGYIRHFSGTIHGQPEGTIIRYRTSLIDLNHLEVFADNGSVSAVYVSNDPTPTWAEDAIIYQVFVDRFHSGEGLNWNLPTSLSGFFGGRVQGITEKLDYIQRMGFNTLWISPIFPSPSHHGYDATDLFTVEPRLGTLEDFTELIQLAHRRKMRILLDFVPNHISNEHPIFQEAITNSISPYVNWFAFTDWPKEYESFFGVKTLPQLNLKDPGARQYMIDAALFWLKLGVDGFRLDYAIGPAQEFWAEFRKQTRQENPDCWTFGEVVDPPDVQQSFEGLLDGCLDFMLLEGIRQTFAFETWTVRRFADFLDRHEAFFPDSFSRPSFLDNHDMNRFLWAADGDQRKLKLAAMCQFSLKRTPIVYYGTEVGISQERDVRQGERGIPEESRLPMPWGDQQDQDLLTYYQLLCHLRNELDCLKRGLRETLYADDQIFAYWRKSKADQALIILNIGPEKKNFVLPSDLMRILLKTGEVNLTSEIGQYAISLDGWSGAILA
jgi:cyclomaltodextrinase